MLDGQVGIIFAAAPVQPDNDASEPVSIPLPEYLPAENSADDAKQLRTPLHQTRPAEWVLILLEVPFFIVISVIGTCYYAFVIYVSFRDMDTDDRILLILFYVLCWVVMYGLSKLLLYIHRSRRKMQQVRRNAFAVEVLSQIDRGSTPYPFSLYLRSFDTDAALIYDRDHVPFTWKRFLWRRLLGLSKVVMFWTFFPERRAVVESVMADALWGWRPLIALGNNKHLRGPGYVSVLDAQWTTAFQSLASNARFILLLPGESRGTMAEIHWLMQSRAIEKVLLLKPKRNKGYDLWWAKVQEACLQHDLNLSNLHENHEILRITASNQVIVATSLKKFSAKNIRSALQNS